MSKSPSLPDHRRPYSSAWRSRPVFISSTFADMHWERDYLETHAFSVLAERLRERRHHLETIDLRLGVETASQTDIVRRELKVLKVCLKEIRRSRPFFVGIIGDRYGWVPPEGRMEAVAGEAGFKAALRGRSVTELEILYGVLESPDQLTRSWFYIREMDYDGMPYDQRRRFDDRLAEDPGAEERVRKLEALKRRLERELPDRVRVYKAGWDPARGGSVTGLESLAAMVLHDLWADMDAETQAWLRDAPKTWQDADLRALEDFVEESTRGFVERPKVLEPVIKLMLASAPDGADRGICLTGESGSGKSSIFGRLYQILRARGEALVLANAAGIYPRSGNVTAMLTRWIHELAAFLEIADPLAGTGQEENARKGPERTSPGPRASASKVEDIEEAFASLLTRASRKKRVVLLIDALNQFERSPRAKYLTWLPEPWPGNVRLAATAVPGLESRALLERAGIAEQQIPPMTEEEARQVAHTYYVERYHREPNARALEALLAKTLPEGRLACGNPLWLDLALQEMNLLQADDYARAERDFPHLAGAERIEALQVREARNLPIDAAGVYGELLGRAEDDWGKAWTRALLDLIALSRAGWRESDLAALVEKASGQPWDNLAFAGVRRTLGSHLVERGTQARWDVFHSQLRQCVLARNLPDEATRRRLHGLMADHLLALPADDPLRITETIVHLIGQGDRTRTARYFGNPKLTEPELGAAARVLAEHAALSKNAMEFMTGLLRADRLTEAEVGGVAYNLEFAGLDALERETGLGTHLQLLEACSDALERLVTREPSNMDWRFSLGACYAGLGNVAFDQGDFERALEAYRKSLATNESLADSTPSEPRWQRAISIDSYTIGRALMEQGNLTGALEAYRRSLAVVAGLAERDPAQPEWQYGLSECHMNVGDVLAEEGDLNGALEAFQKSRMILEHLASDEPSNPRWQRSLAVVQQGIGDVLLEQGHAGRALSVHRQALLISERLARSDPSQVSWQWGLNVSHSRVGNVLAAQGNMSEALKAYRRALDIAVRLADKDPVNATFKSNVSVRFAKVGDVLRWQGDTTGALEAYRKSLDVMEELVRSDPSNANRRRGLSVCHSMMGSALRRGGDLNGALKAYRRSQAILETLVRSDPSNASRRYDLGVIREMIAGLLREQGDLTGALAEYRRSLETAEMLAESKPSNTTWQRGLSVIRESIGHVLIQQGDPAGAMEMYRKSIAIVRRLVRSDPSNATWQRDLVLSHSNLAMAAAKANKRRSAKYHWRQCRRILLGMKEAGAHLDPSMQQLLKRLETGKDGA
jgi:tetratricopeptide (TPR) repeat protein